MTKKQPELPGTRNANEPGPKSIPALDAACDVLEKAKGKATKATQHVVEARQKIDALMREHKITSYVYEDSNGVERKAFINESIKTTKIKKDKKDGSGGDE